MSETDQPAPSGCHYPDTFAGRLRAYSDAWRNHAPDDDVIGEAPDAREPLLRRSDLDAALTEIVQLERRLDNLRFELRATEPCGVMQTPLAERTEAIRARWMAFGFSGATGLDHERDQVIGWLLDQVDNATARAEKAEAALAEMRERLGTSRDEWANHYRSDAGVDYYNGPLESVEEARQAFAQFTGWRLVTRVVGEWRDANTVPHTALERAADEQGVREGGGDDQPSA